MKKLFALPVLVLTAAFAILLHAGESTGVDAVSAASITLANGTITSTSAVVNYSGDRYSNGTRTLCYDPAPASPTNNCTAKAATCSRTGSFTLTGLTPATSYNYKVTATDGRHNPYSASGTFKTLAGTARKFMEI